MIEFRQYFSNDNACRNYLIECRWPNGFICPKCKNLKFWPRRGGKLIECSKCHYNASPMSGTIMHGSHIPIQAWFWGAYLVTTLTPGISAIQLQRQMGIGSYRTAWFMLNRLRKAMVNDSRSNLCGLIEADETIIGGPVKGKRGRGVTKDENVSLVIGAIEIVVYTDKKGEVREKAGRLRLIKIERADEPTIKAFLHKTVVPKSMIRTDGWRGYTTTALKNYEHDLRVVGTTPAHQLAPHIHRVFSNLKTWLNGTHHGVDPKYLQNYLDEFVFRFNRRQNPMAGFQTLLGIAGQKNPLSLSELKKRDSSA